MKAELYSVITLLLFIALVFVSNGFTQQTLLELSVRLIYFLPNDRPARPDRIEALRQLIKDAQQFFADEMQRHGFGRKTFTIETDRKGEPVVHHIDGKFTAHYYSEPLIDFKIWEEVFAHFDDFQHVYFIAIDMSRELMSGGLGGPMFFPSNIDQPAFSFGSVSVRHRDITEGEEMLGGSAIIPAYDERLGLTAHELGHAFGLEHDFREGIYNTYVMGYGNQDQLSICNAEWLAVNPFFNSNLIIHNARAEIRLISPLVYSPDGIKLHFEVTDADGLYQAQLLVPAIYEGTSWGPYRLFDCKQLNGETSTIEFINEKLTVEPVDRIALQIIDVNGNITWATFLVDIASALPPPKFVSIPDTNLAEVVRKALDLSPNARITDQKMWGLKELNATAKQIKNLTGLEHATQLTRLFLYNNRIRDVSPLAKLTQLEQLGLDGNQISNIRPLTGLTQLELLHIGGNKINNAGVRLLTPLKQLKSLDLSGNRIGNIKPLASLTKLEGLWLAGNKVRDVSRLAGLVNLEVLKLKGNPIKDLSPLANLLNLRETDINIPDPPHVNRGMIPDANLAAAVQEALGLGPNARITKQKMKKLIELKAPNRKIKDLTGLEHATQLTFINFMNNQIRDVSPLTGLTQLRQMSIDENHIRDIMPIASLKNLWGLGLGWNTPKISDITPLASLTKLKWLRLTGNQIRDVSPLAELTNLETLWIKQNRIQDFSPLTKLKKLRNVDIAIPRLAGAAPTRIALSNQTLLLANYPNPFNPETWIPYQLANPSDVKITIYDARGSVIRQLELGHQSAGIYTSQSRAAYWDGRNTQGERVASGIYFYQLQVGNVSSLREMLILK